MDSAGRKVIVWTGTSSGLNFEAVEALLKRAAESAKPLAHVRSPAAATDTRGRTGRRLSRLGRSGSQPRSGSVASVASVASAQEGYCPPLHLVLALRDEQSQNCIDAVMHFRELAELSGSVIESHACDLADLAAVRTFAARVMADHDAVSAVVLGAAIACWGPPSYANDGYELGLTVNHLAQWLLVYLLRDRIVDRVVFVGSALYRSADLRGIKLNARRKGGPHKPVAYNATKTVQALCVAPWVEHFRPRGVDVLYCTPG
ncbi:uncharacterized protein V1510DRAFT_348789, partial [Dipodascopsis tothii]|uniref:uncharacterized protein n=1 Tax=Dipodascopsis tothii TaxID=44089 RepID=UPI0034CFFC98